MVRVFCCNNMRHVHPPSQNITRFLQIHVKPSIFEQVSSDTATILQCTPLSLPKRHHRHDRCSNNGFNGFSCSRPPPPPPVVSCPSPSLPVSRTHWR